MSFEVQVVQAMPKSPTTKRSASKAISPSSKRAKVTAEQKSIEAEKKEADKAAKAEGKALREAEKANERAVKEAERVAKAAEKEREKTTKEEERVAREKERDEQRQEKDQRKRMKEEAKASEKRAKDEARAKELAAIERKERAQLKMNTFFKVAIPKPVPVLAKEESSIFKPFYMKENTRLAYKPSLNAQGEDEFTRSIGNSEQPTSNISDILNMALHKKKSLRACYSRTPRLTIRERLREVSSKSLDERLDDVSYRLLQFHSDVRPAYYGTMSATPSTRGLATGRRPLARTSELNYDYDSEADWIEGDDEDAGEEIGDDDDVSVASRDTYGDDDDDFLDDVDDQKSQVNERRRQMGSLIPSILGIFDDGNCEPVAHMRLQKLIDTQLPIDPFENYWDPMPDERPSALADSTKCLNGVVKNTEDGAKSPVVLRKSSNITSCPAFPEDLLPEFKKAILGSAMTKILLVEKLRIEFRAHKVTKKMIEEKLGEVAHRQGKGQHHVWVLNE